MIQLFLLCYPIQTLWRGMYLRYVTDTGPAIHAEQKAQDIVRCHIEARNKVVHLRRKLQVCFYYLIVQ